MADERQCFIIMPITTPEGIRDRYRDGADHFRHVLECLLIPSVRKAKFQPIPPIAKGSDLIHAEIVRQLEAADLVLCDMSTLNPNVFFELGIRTALNKPVCVLKDEITDKVPFDTGILNHQEYRSTLNPWELDADIDKVAEHIETSFARSKGANTLWRYFGVKSEALPAHGEAGAEDKLDLLFLQMDALRQKLDSVTVRPEDDALPEPGSSLFHLVNRWLVEALSYEDAQIQDIDYPSPRKLIVRYKGELPDKLAARLCHEAADRFGLNLVLSAIAPGNKGPSDRAANRGGGRSR